MDLLQLFMPIFGLSSYNIVLVRDKISHLKIMLIFWITEFIYYNILINSLVIIPGLI